MSKKKWMLHASMMSLENAQAAAIRCFGGEPCTLAPVSVKEWAIHKDGKVLENWRVVVRKSRGVDRYRLESGGLS